MNSEDRALKNILQGKPVEKVAWVDNKMWTLFGHCFDCQVDFEHDLRTTGKFEEWQSSKVLRNKKSIILEQIQSIENWQQQGDLKVVEPVNPESGAVHIETYEVDPATKKLAEQALIDLNNALQSINDTIEKFDGQRK